MYYWRQATLTFALALAGMACDKAPTQGATPAVVEILAPFTSIFEKDFVRLTAKVLDASGAVLSDVPVTWSSSNPNIASVNSFGEVSGVSPGDATITATARQAKGTITVHVDPPPGSVRIVTPQPLIVRTGRSLQLAAEVRDRGGNVLPKAFVSWSVKAAAAPERPGAATVDSAARLAGVTMGSVIITATVGTATVGPLVAVVQGYVRSRIAAIEFAADSLRLVLGDQHDIIATDSAGTVITSDVTWELSSNDPAVAAVEGSTVIRAAGVGRTSVRISAEEMTAVVPVRVETFSFTSVAPGNHFACGLTARGEALCWGVNDHLQLGVVTPRRCKTEFFCPHSDKSIPVFVSGGLTFTSLAVGGYHVCGIASSGSAYCWGGDQLGQLGTSASVSPCPQSGGSDRCSAVPRAVEGGRNFIAIAGTDVRTCALTLPGTAYCWGWYALPELVPGGLTFRNISSGISVTCATTANDLAYCWGSNESGQLGIGSSGAQQTTPVAVTGGISFGSAGAGGTAACGISTSGKVYCWGEGLSLGVSPAPEQCQAPVGGFFFGCATRPTPIASDLTFKDLTVAGSMACALTADGAVYCWNFVVRLPTLVRGIPPLRSIRAGYFSACGLTADNVAYCWDSTMQAARGPGQ